MTEIGFKSVLLGDIANIRTGKLDSNAANEGGTYPFFTCAPAPLRINTYAFDQEAILLAGNNAEGNFHINYYSGKFNAYQRTYVIDCKEPQVCNLRYLYYALILCLVSFKRQSQGTSTRFLTKKLLDGFEISLPDMEYQLQIVEILSVIDSKIEKNNLANDYLLEMLIALQGQISSRVQLTECRADQAFDIHIGKTPPRKQHEWFSFDHADNVIWMSIKDMGNAGAYLIDSSEYLTRRAVEKFNIRYCKPGSILLSFKLTIGRVGIVAHEMVTNEAIACFSSGDARKLAWIYPQLKTYDYASLGSTSSIATAVNSKMIKAMPISMPTDSDLDAFYRDAKPIYDLLLTNTIETSSLEQLRDTLLPKLMSGEIDVSEVELSTQPNNHLLSGR